MAEKFRLSKEAFWVAAQAAGLDTRDAHMEELYVFVRNVLSSLREIDELDLTDLEPVRAPLVGKEIPR